MKNKLTIEYVFIFFILAIFSLNFNFIEGDDAKTVLFHVLGRNKDLQPPYSAYHSMFDVLLSLFNTNNEFLLRHFAIGISFVFGFFFLACLSYLIILKSTNDKKSIFVILIMLPFILPEILFGSLIVNPVLISITLILLSHIFFIKYVKNKSYKFLVLSILLFGLGVSFRWNNGFYLFFLFGDYILNEKSKISQVISIDKLKKSFFIFPFYIFSLVIFIQISGYSLNDIYSIYNSGSSYIDNLKTSYFVVVSSSITFLTPSLLLLLILGIFFGFKHKRYKNFGLLIFALIPYLLLSISPSFKYMINLTPIIVLLIIQGYAFIINKYLKYLVLVLILIPWFVGIQIDTNSNWGPGFEVNIKKRLSDIRTGNNPDNYIVLNNLKFVIGQGMAVPTLEGPRPLFGFGSVLFNKWFSFVENNNKERLDAVLYAELYKCRILQDVKHSFISSKLLERNYHTNQAYNKKVRDNFKREFTNGNDSIIINVFNNKNDLLNSDIIEHYMEDKHQVVIYSSYTNIISKMKAKYQNRFLKNGAYWGVLKH